jgi:hypothetical protein
VRGECDPEKISLIRHFRAHSSGRIRYITILAGRMEDHKFVDLPQKVIVLIIVS